MNKLIYHITQRLAWEQARPSGYYQAPSQAAEGFMHCSTRAQVLSTAERHYHGVPGLVLLCIDATRVPAEIRYENTSGGEILFPHIYGPLPVTAVLAVNDFPVRPDGGFDWPAGATTE